MSEDGSVSEVVREGGSGLKGAREDEFSTSPKYKKEIHEKPRSGDTGFITATYNGSVTILIFLSL